MHQQTASRVYGRADDSSRQHSAPDGPILWGDGGVHHLRPDLRGYLVPAGDARPLHHHLPHSPGAGVKIIILSLLLLLSSCRVGPDYRRPPVNTPTGFRGSNAQQQESFADLPWWEIFKDEALKE